MRNAAPKRDEALSRALREERQRKRIRNAALEEAARAADPETENGSPFNDGRREAARRIRALKGGEEP